MMLEKTEVRLGGNVRFLQSPGIACFTAVGGRALDVCLGKRKRRQKSQRPEGSPLRALLRIL